MFKKMAILQDQAESATPTGTASSPAPTEVVETPVETPTATDTSVDNAGAGVPVDWDAESRDEDDADDGSSSSSVVSEPTPAAASPASETPVSAPVPAPVVAAPVAPAAQPVSAAPAAPAAAPVAEPQPPARTAAEIEADRAAALKTRQEEEEKLFTGLVDYYKLPEDLQLKLSTEPENVLPYLAARIHQSISQQLTKAIQEVLPVAVRHVNAAETTEAKAKEEFFSAWPQLKGKEKEILMVGAQFRQLNPNADKAKAVQTIGKTVCEMLGIPLTAENLAAIGTTSAAPVVSTPKPAAFVPAGGGGSGRGAAPAGDNLFSNLAEEFLAEDS